jgi:hypothetical protein
MKKLFIMLSIVALFALAAMAQDKAAAKGKPEAKAPAMSPEMEAYMKVAAPGENHKVLEAWVGTWNADIKMWMAPGAEAMLSKGTGVFKIIYGGRFLQGEFTGDWMGQPFLGTEIMGYDNVQKKFVGFWVDNSSTWFMTSTGSYDKAKKAFHMTSTMLDPITGKSKTEREVTTFETPDKVLAQSFEPGPDGKEFKMMEIVYTKIK